MLPTLTSENARIPQTGFDTPASPFTALDPNIAKQMAALSQYSLARNAASGRPPSGALSAQMPPAANGLGFSGQLTATNDPISASAISADPTASHPPSADMQARPGSNTVDPLKQRQRNFYSSLAQLMTTRGTPLPPGIVGFPWPQGYDPASSPFKVIEQGSEPGFFRLAGKDVNLFKLWTTIMAAGGANKISQMNGWPTILQAMELPEQMPNPNPQNLSVGNTVPVLPYLVRHYQILLHPFVEWYQRNLQDSQRKALAARQQQQQAATDSQAQPTAAATPTTAAPTPAPLAATPATETPAPEAASSQPTPAPSQTPQQEVETPGTEAAEIDSQGLKRKYEAEIPESKRTRPRTESDTSEPKVAPDTNSSEQKEPNAAPSAPTTSMPPESSQKTLQKVEYLPVARQIETHGGRDLRVIDAELTKALRKPLRDHNDWGVIEVEVLTLFIRSRIPADMSYALATFTLLSTMRGQVPGSGFPIHNCAELFDEVLDLMEDEAFGETPDTEPAPADDEIFTNHLLIKTFREAESAPFAILDKNRPLARRKSLDKGGPQPSASNLIKAVTNIIRNLSVITDNQAWLGREKRWICVLLRLCEVVRGKDGKLRSVSPVLSLGDVVAIRKDTINILANLGLHLRLSPKPAYAALMTKRIFKLAASYLIDPAEATHPVACAQLSSSVSAPPKLADLALEAFTRLSSPDYNRQALSKLVPERHLWSLIEALAHRLPVDDADYQLGMREAWLSYIEKTVFSLYSLFFLASPYLKRKIKSNRRLGVTAVMTRMVTKFMMVNEIRVWYQICAKRTIEALKVLDDAEDSFMAPASNVSDTLSFGIGYGEGETTRERGTGLWGGRWDVAWDLLTLRELDGETFGELDSLLRVET